MWIRAMKMDYWRRCCRHLKMNLGIRAKMRISVHIIDDSQMSFYKLSTFVCRYDSQFWLHFIRFCSINISVEFLSIVFTYSFIFCQQLPIFCVKITHLTRKVEDQLVFFLLKDEKVNTQKYCELLTVPWSEKQIYS